MLSHPWRQNSARREGIIATNVVNCEHISVCEEKTNTVRIFKKKTHKKYSMFSCLENHKQIHHMQNKKWGHFPQ